MPAGEGEIAKPGQTHRCDGILNALLHRLLNHTRVRIRIQRRLKVSVKKGSLFAPIHKHILIRKSIENFIKHYKATINLEIYDQVKHFRWSFLVGSYGEGGSAHRDPYVARLPLKLRRQEEVIGLRGIDEHFQLEALGGVSV